MPLLNGEEIRKRGLIQNPVADGYKAASYDLHVGKIITSSGEEKTSFTLKSQATVLAISSERVKLPKNVAGYATVKTRLCHDGILALNIGIIDPDYEGLVSSYLINFGKKDFSLNAGQVFLRLSMHEFAESEKAPDYPKISDAEYVNERKKEAVATLSETFLHLPMNIKPLTDEVLSEWRKGLFTWVPALALVMTLLAFAVTLGVSYGGREVPSKEQLKAELTREIVDETKEKLKTEGLKEFEGRLKKLEEDAQKAAQKAAAQGNPASGRTKP